MNSASVLLNYRKAAVMNASPVGLVIILYDTLVGDLTRAIDAIEKGDIEGRSAQIKHALLVLHQLEGSLDMEKGGEAAVNLSRFYSFVRGKLLEAHIKVQPDVLKQQIDMILDVRQAWQQVDVPQPVQPNPAGSLPPSVYGTDDNSAGSGTWSA